MLSIGEIKKVCEFAEGFEVDENKIMLITGKWVFIKTFAMTLSTSYYLFLQRVIEGINYSELVYCINQDQSGLRVWNDEKKRGDNFYLWNHDNINQTKEQAIKYILERI